MPTDREQQIESERRDIGRGTILPGALLLVALGIAALSDQRELFFPILGGASLAAGMMLAGVIALLLRTIDQRLSVIALVLCYLIAIWLAIAISGQPWLLTLILLPVGVCAIGLDPAAGAALMALITMLFIWAPGMLSAGPVQARLISALIGWTTLG